MFFLLPPPTDLEGTADLPRREKEKSEQFNVPLVDKPCGGTARSGEKSTYSQVWLPLSLKWNKLNRIEKKVLFASDAASCSQLNFQLDSL